MGPGKIGPSQQKIERELSRVSAQLKSMSETESDESDTRIKTDAPEPAARPEVSVPDAGPAAIVDPASEQASTDGGEPAFEPETEREKPEVGEPTSGGIEAVDTDESGTEPVSPGEASEEEKKVAATFGRPKHRHGIPPESGDSASQPISPADTQLESKDGYSTKNITFGRSKRKRTR
jgi:hypothetical protein